MNVTLYGAASEVTGSCFLVETGNSRVLVDCGMFQGPERLERLNYIPKNILPAELNAVVLTHGHLDHCGRLPLLLKAGFDGPIYATPATIDIAMLIMQDSAHIQEDDARRENKKRAGSKYSAKAQPLYTAKDVENVRHLFHPVEYNWWQDISEDIRFQFVDAGHILGSSSVEMVCLQPTRRHLVFSGDLGQWDVPIMHDPAVIKTADCVFMESTYGDREHKGLPESLAEFRQTLLDAWKTKGKVLIPTFAVGRTQQILYYLAQMFADGSVPVMDVYLDSPMAIAATEIYGKHEMLLDDDATIYGASRLKNELPSLRFCTTVEESKAINDAPGPCIILAGAGMCNGGRILHHLKNNLGYPNTYVIVAGYQTKGSLGRLLLEGAKQIKMFGETVNVRAQIHSIGGFSAHAGQSGLLRWLGRMAEHNPRVVLIHGEPNALNELSYQIKDRYGIEPQVPKMNERIAI